MRIGINVLATIGAAAVLTATLLANDPAREQKLQQAIDLIESKGDFARAIPLLEDASKSTDRALAARALLYLGQAQERSDKNQARKTYQRIVTDFRGQAQTIAAAQSRLGRLEVGRKPDPLIDRQVLVGGQRFVFSSITDGVMAIAADSTAGLSVRDMATGAVTQVVEKGLGIFPILSPSRKQLVYLDLGDGGEDPAIRIVANMTGAQPTTLLRKTTEIVDFWPRGWSRDGLSVLVELQRADKTWQFAWVSSSDSKISPLRSLEWRRPGGPERRVSFSPDGRFIAYAALARNPSGPTPGPNDSTDKHIYVLALDGSSETEVTKTASVDETPVWSADGSHLLFVSDRAGSVDLWAVAVADGKPVGSPVQLKPDIGRIVPIGMAESGTFYYTAAAGSPNARWEISEVDMASGRASGARRSFMASRDITVSPDGTLAAFLRERGARAANQIEGDLPDLVVHTLATGAETRFRLPGRGRIGAAGPLWWSHDAKSVILVRRVATDSVQPPDSGARPSIAPRRVTIDRLDVRSGQLTELASPDIDVSAVTPDGQTLYGVQRAVGQPSCIVALDVVSQQRRQVFCTPVGVTIFRGPRLSPDGRSLALTINSGQMQVGIARVGIDGADYRHLFQTTVPRGLAGIYDLIWSRDNRALFFTEDMQPPAPPRIMRLQASGGTPEFTGLQLNSSFSSIAPKDNSHLWMFVRTDSQNELRAIDNVTAVLKSAR